MQPLPRSGRTSGDLSWRKRPSLPKMVRTATTCRTSGSSRTAPPPFVSYGTPGIVGLPAAPMWTLRGGIASFFWVRRSVGPPPSSMHERFEKAPRSATTVPPPPPRPATPEVAAPAKPDTTPPDTANALDMLDPRVLMKVDLWNLARSQEAFFQMQGFYARRAENLALQYLWHKGVQVKVLAADAESWVAK